LLHLRDIRAALGDHRPRLVGAERDPFASVAMVLSGPHEDPDVLFIERARHEGDPWSGHMAFPGGRYEQPDGDLRRTAERETCEEVGVDLSHAEKIGRLDDQEGRRAGASGGIFIAAYVYYLESPPRLELSREVEEAMWVPTSRVVDPQNRVDYEVEYAPGVFPGILVGHPERHVVWGLTYRFVSSFLELLER
jgi:8-oxo-dGTP pyrophosphatase MutT (NUDIX family)